MHAVDRLSYTPGTYFATHELGYLVSIERAIWSITSFIIWFRLLKCAAAAIVGCARSRRARLTLRPSPSRQSL